MCIMTKIRFSEGSTGLGWLTGTVVLETPSVLFYQKTNFSKGSSKTWPPRMCH